MDTMQNPGQSGRHKRAAAPLAPPACRRCDDDCEERVAPGEYVTLAVASVLFLANLVFEQRLHHLPYRAVEYVIAFAGYLLAGRTVVMNALRTVRQGRLFDENVLMTIATAGAFAVHALNEAVGVMIFYKAGELLQNLAVRRSRRSIRSLLAVRPDHANVKRDGTIVTTAAADVAVGETIVVRAGERVPLDGCIDDGNSRVDASALTGESLPVSVRAGDPIAAGAINLTGVLTIRVTRPFGESSIARILDLVENAAARKARTERFITVFARFYTPAVVALAILVAVVPPVCITGFATLGSWVYRALVLLVISCPCALVISIPLGYFGGIGALSRRGILVKGSDFVDALSHVKTVVFDKTGTLTKGVFTVTAVIPVNGRTPLQLLELAGRAESHSNHPIAQSIMAACAREGAPVNLSAVDQHREFAGEGVAARHAGRTILAGNDALMAREGVAHDPAGPAGGTVVHIAVDRQYAGYLVIGDEVKEDSPGALARLRRAGVPRIVMLTGDNDGAARVVAERLHLDEYYAGLTPGGKVLAFDKLASASRRGGTIAFVGDGINDAPVLARADVGIAMGHAGADAAVESADVVLMTDSPSKVAEAIGIARATRRIIRQNIVFALSVKGLFAVLGTAGLATMWEAVFADMGVALIALANSMRTLVWKARRLS